MERYSWAVSYTHLDVYKRQDSGDVAFTYQLHNKRVPLHGACEMRIGVRRDRLEDKSKYYVAGVLSLIHIYPFVHSCYGNGQIQAFD